MNTVVNLTHIVLDKSELSILERGLNFIPTPHTLYHTPILKAATDFGRRLKLAYHFRNSKNSKFHKMKFTNKSEWTPSDKNIDETVLNKIKEIHDDISNLVIPKHTIRNLTADEFQALQTLRRNSDIVIKPADKGSATVIMDKECYIAEGYRQLNNAAHYRKLDAPIYPETATEIRDILIELCQQHFITQKQLLYLLPPSDPRPRQLYLLPKIHKPSDKWPVRDKMPPGRPIISDCSSESYTVAEYIDNFLQPFSVVHASYVKDTNDFLAKLRAVRTKPDSLLVTLDVESMYTNIDNEDGLEAVRKAFLSQFDSYRSDEHILKLLELGLKNNDFVFNDEFFLQISGTAMGKKFAPSYANIFMANWEEEALEKCYQKPTMYLRYLDDIFLIWDHGETNFWTFFDILNSHHPSIKLTARVEKESIDFLDVSIFKGPSHKSTGHLETKVFFKPTDTHQLLHKASFHPKHTFSGIIKSQIMRFHRICSRESDFNEACTTLFRSLRRRGYSIRFLRTIKSQTVQTFSKTSAPKPPIFDQIDIVNDHRASPCGHSPQCHTCDSVRSCDSIQSSTTKQNFQITGDLNCSSSNIIYLIECNFCKKQYIGETKRSLRCRFNNHRFDIQNQRPSTISSHFNQGCCDLDDCRIIPIFKCPKLATEELTTKARQEIEQYFIRTLKTYLPYGLNIAQTRYKDVPSIHFVLPYSSLATMAVRIVRKNYRELQERFPHIFHSTMIAAFSRNKNLKDSLVSAKIR